MSQLGIDTDRLEALARGWIAGDPDPATREELAALVDAGAWDEVRDRVDGSLAFGTAGIRGIVGAGPLRMNRAVVIRTTHGLADHLRGAVADLDDRVVVVGFDARPDSRRFAADTVGVLAAAGITVRYFPDPTPTPLVAYAAKRLGAAAAVVVTASHNPPEYNGYKVYGPDAVQIVPPTDEAIAAAIDAAPPAAEIPRADDPWLAEGVAALGEETVAAYLDEVLATAPEVATDPIRIVYTPLHGVGWRLVQRALAAAGHDRVHVVDAQAEPDGRFPTVAFPNPEEPGALDLALATAREVRADVVLANDPDADRLALAAPDAARWRMLTGNQLGALLGDHLLATTPTPNRPLVVSSIVSSPMLTAVAAAHGAHHEVTLTGFKWICTAALALTRDRDLSFVLGYEEALGYTVGEVVRDKDGIGAAVVAADLVAALRREGRTVQDRLADLYRRCGLWVSIQHSVTRTGAEGARAIDAAMARIGRERPRTLAGREVTAATDFRHGAAERPPWLPATPLVALDLEDGSRVLVRPSGTEPKLKIYADLRADLAPGADVDAAERRLRREAEQAAGELAAFLEG